MNELEKLRVSKKRSRNSQTLTSALHKDSINTFLFESAKTYKYYKRSKFDLCLYGLLRSS